MRQGNRKRVVNNLIRNQIVRGVFAVASGSVVAQIITVLASPLITRLYGPEAFGQLGVFNSAVNLIAPAAALTFPIAIVLPSRNSEAKQLVKLSLLSAGLICTVVGVLLYYFSVPIVTFMGLEAVERLLFLVPVTVLFATAQQVGQQWLVRTKRFGATGKVSAVQALTVNVTQILAGLLQPVGAALIWVSSIGRLLHAALLALAARRGRPEEREAENDPPATLREMAHRYRDFALYRAPQEFVTAASYSLPVIALAALLNPAAAGLYTLTQTVLGMPSRLIGSAVGSVFYPHIAEAARAGDDLVRPITRASLALLGVGILPYSCIVLFGPGIFTLVFGADWQEAGQFASWLALAHLSAMMTRPAAQALPVLAAQRFSLVLSSVTLLLRLAALYVGLVVIESAVHAIAAYSIVGFIANLTLLLAVLRMSRRFDPGNDPGRFS